MIDTVFLLAGGLGTRLGELTKKIPKPMIDINGKPLLERELDWYSSFGIKKAVLAVGYKSEVIEDYFGREHEGVEIVYSREEEPLGTGGALKLARELLPREFVYANGDLLMDFDLFSMVSQHERTRAVVTMGLKRIEGDLSRFGTVELDGLRVKRFVEKTPNPPSNLVHAGVSVMNEGVFEFIPEGRSSMEKQVFPVLAEQGLLHGFVVDGFWIDVGVPEDLERARKTIKN